MVYKQVNMAIFFRLTVIIGCTITSTWAALSERWAIVGLMVMCVVLSSVKLIRLYHSINRKLTYFFESIQNNDTSLRFPENTGSRSDKALHMSLNTVNKVISEVKIRSVRQERLYTEFLKFSATGILVVDEKGYVEIVNESALKLFDIKMLIHMDRLTQNNQFLYYTLTRLKPNESRVIKLAADHGLSHVSVRLSVLKFENQTYRLYSIGDIQSVLDENEIQTTQKMLRIMTHEIMNSITPISSISETLMGYFRNDKEISQKEFGNISKGLDAINERSIGLMHFVESYRSLAKTLQPQFAPINLGDWLSTIKLLFSERTIQEGLAFEIIDQYEGSTFMGDKQLLAQVVLNLLNNAAEAVKGTQKKCITIKVTGREEEFISIKFCDTGAGIPVDNLDQIFMPFFTTKEKGSGIGLSISRQITTLHKGKLSVRSVVGEGSEFEVRI